PPRPPRRSAAPASRHHLAGVQPLPGGRPHRRQPVPRVAGAGAVTLDGAVASVASGERRYQVRESDGRLTCTCQWWADYRGKRGPCKHALAVTMVRRGATVTGGVR
ncbi:hypothetical protein DKT74_20255, partial [Streptomyces sp. ZEA17I]